MYSKCSGVKYPGVCGTFHQVDVWFQQQDVIWSCLPLDIEKGIVYVYS